MAQGRQVMKMNPKNTRCIVWAISRFFLYFILCLINTNKYIKVLFMFSRASGKRWQRKWAQTTPDMSFGRSVSFFFFFHV